VPIEFPLPEKQTRFGRLPDPKITIHVRTHQGYFPYRFLLDTGADLSMVPLSMADDLGIDLASCPRAQCSGIEGRPMLVYQAAMAVRISHVDLTVRCLIVQSDATPFLLNRADLFARSTITFNYRRNQIALTEI
jgi:predicted aspartyl protease